MCVLSGAAGLAFMRVLGGGAVDAAKPIKEGLTEQQLADLLAATQAQEVRARGQWQARLLMGGMAIWARACFAHTTCKQVLTTNAQRLRKCPLWKHLSTREANSPKADVCAYSGGSIERLKCW